MTFDRIKHIKTALSKGDFTEVSFYIAGRHNKSLSVNDEDFEEQQTTGSVFHSLVL